MGLLTGTGEAVDAALATAPVGDPHAPGSVDRENDRIKQLAVALAVAAAEARRDATGRIEGSA